MKPQFYNFYYRYHKKNPCGVGTWIFRLPQNQVLWYCNMKYSVAKKDAMRIASETGSFFDNICALLPNESYLVPLGNKGASL